MAVVDLVDLSFLIDDAKCFAMRASIPGAQHKTVCHGRGENVRDEDGDGIARCTSTRWKASGPRCARTAAFRRSTCRFISPSSSSCTTFSAEAKHCLASSWPTLSADGVHHLNSNPTRAQKITHPDCVNHPLKCQEVDLPALQINCCMVARSP